MDEDRSARLGLPFLFAGQAQKELTHNAALERIDRLLHACVETGPVDAPPVGPLVGQCWIVGSAPDGAWEGMADHIACWTATGWDFVAPVEGMAVWIGDAGVTACRAGAAWRIGTLSAHAVAIDGTTVLGSQQPAIGNPVGGDIIDENARAVLGAVLSALRSHGIIAG